MARTTLTNNDINEKTLVNSDFSAITVNLLGDQLGRLNKSADGSVYFSSANSPYTDHLNYGQTTRNVVRKQLDVIGQGTVIIEMDQPIPFTIKLTKAHSNRPTDYHLLVSANETDVVINEGSRCIQSSRTDHVESPVGIRNKYWLSINKTTKVIKYGWGEPRPLLTTINLDENQPQLQSLEDIYLEYTNRDADNTPVSERSNQEPVPNIQRLLDEKRLTIRVLPSPVPDQERSLLLLPLGTQYRHGHEIPKDISQEVADLYNCITYYKSMIDDGCRKFPQFVQSIRKSIIHQNGICKKILQEKAKSSSFGLPGTYLRITFGEPQGNSPGHRFVLEIWPEDHFSPIHQHADAHGVIMVYHGHILVSLYSALDPANQIPFKKKLFSANDITYLTRDLNQTHKVENVSQDVCLTMQCYQYEARDREHYGSFQIIKNYDMQQTHPSNPKSDMDFKDFLNKMHEEWLTTYAMEVQE